MSTYHMPSAMKALCNRVCEYYLDGVELEPSDLERQALRWAWPMAKKAGHTKGTEMRWYHKGKDQWINFKALSGRRVLVSLTDESNGKALREALGLEVAS
jgi:hypothetical protein